MNKSDVRSVTRRDDAFVEKTQTRIWYEESTKHNPYIAENVYCYGYDLSDLLENCSYIEVLYLLFKGELPDADARQLLEKLMIGLINPGPRHPSTRAAMNAGVGKTLPVHILPIASMVMGGERQCAGAVENCIRFFRKKFRQPAELVAEKWLSIQECERSELWGFGQHYGGVHIQAKKLADRLIALPGAGEVLMWGDCFAKQLNASAFGWLPVGVAAAVFADLGFNPKLGGALYQLFSAPGLIAHGIELTTKPLTAMPHVKDEDYVIKNRT